MFGVERIGPGVRAGGGGEIVGGMPWRGSSDRGSMALSNWLLRSILSVPLVLAVREVVRPVAASSVCSWMVSIGSDCSTGKALTSLTDKTRTYEALQVEELH